MKKILVIDYDQSSLQTLHKALTQEGFEVVLASDGQSGWEKFQSEKPDLVLMEAMLSKIHGFELCDRITKDPAGKAPVFIMTGVYKDRVYRTEALRTYGASEYFEKPLDMLKFMASIHGVLTVPDIKPEPSVEPSNGRPPVVEEPAPEAKPFVEEPRQTEPPAPVPPRPRAPRPEAPRPKPAAEGRTAGGAGLSLETVLNIRTAKDAPAKAASEHKTLIDDEVRLESLLNDIAAAAEDHHRAEPAKGAHPVAVAPKEKDLQVKPHEHIHKDQTAADIDQLLKTTLADFGLESEKKKPAKPAAAPAPAVARAPVPAPEKPKPAAPIPPAPVQKPRPIPPPPPAPPAAAAPEKSKPVPSPPPSPTPAVAEKPKPAPPAPQPAPPQPKAKASAQAAPAAAAAPAVAPAAIARPAVMPSKSKPEPVIPPKTEPKPEPKEQARKAETHKAAEARMFKDIYEVEKKKSALPFIAVGAGLIVVAAVAFFLLRPKHNASPAGLGVNTPVAQVQSTVLEKAPDTTLPSLSEEKLKAVNPKPKPAPPVARPAEPMPTAEEAIAPPPIVDISRLNAKAAPGKKPEAKPSEANPGAAKPADQKAGESQVSNPPATGQGQPPTGTEATASQGSTAVDAGASTAQAPKANPGDLVDLATVDEAPKVIKSVEPVYPAQAARFGKQGSVTINALINEAGVVVETGIVKGLKDDMGLEKAAVDAVRKWKFQPAKKDGVNVKVWKPIVITFKTAQARTT